MVGFANTAADISTELVGHAKKGRRFATIAGTMAAIAPIRSLSIQDRRIDRTSKSCSKLDPAWNFRPAPSRSTNRVMVSDTFIPRLADGSIKSVANLTQIIDKNTVELADGSNISVDCIIFCTGYARDPPLVTGIEEPIPSSNAQDNAKNHLQLRRLYQIYFLLHTRVLLRSLTAGNLALEFAKLPTSNLWQLHRFGKELTRC